VVLKFLAEVKILSEISGVYGILFLTKRFDRENGTDSFVHLHK